MRDKILTTLLGLSVSVLSGCSMQHAAKTDPVVVSANSANGVNGAKDQLCVNDFAVLKSVNPASFAVYRKQFEDINNAYAFYQKDVAILGKDPKELLGMGLSTKLHLVCSRVKYAVYTEIQKKLEPIYDL